MATIEQMEANRENAKLSTGPTSCAGLERSSRNATKHGLAGRTVYLTASEEEPCRQFQEGIFTSFGPKGTLEESLVDSIVDSRWRVLQISKIEAGLYSIGKFENKAELTNYPADEADQGCRALTFSRKQKEFDALMAGV